MSRVWSLAVLTGGRWSWRGSMCLWGNNTEQGRGMEFCVPFFLTTWGNLDCPPSGRTTPDASPAVEAGQSFHLTLFGHRSAFLLCWPVCQSASRNGELHASP